MSRKIWSNLIKTKDKLRDTFKQKIAKPEKKVQIKNLQAMLKEQGNNLGQGIRKATERIQDIGSKKNLKTPTNLFKGLSEISLKEKISKITQTAHQKDREKEQSKIVPEAFNKNNSGLIGRLKLLSKGIGNQNMLSQAKQSLKKQGQPISQIQDKSKDTKWQMVYLMDFLKAKAKNLDCRLKELQEEMKQSNLSKASSIPQLLRAFIINFYWRFIFFIAFTAFAYGFGSSMPKEIRKALRERQEKLPPPTA